MLNFVKRIAGLDSCVDTDTFKRLSDENRRLMHCIGEITLERNMLRDKIEDKEKEIIRRDSLVVENEQIKKEISTYRDILE